MAPDSQRSILSIKQTADLYGLTNSALYYYEQIGLLTPERNKENGYRIYRGEDFIHLNVIKTLQNMGIPLEQIKRFEQNHTMPHSLELLRDELQRIDIAIEALRQKQREVEHAVIRYSQALIESLDEELTDDVCPERPFLLLCDEPELQSNFPLIYAEKMRALGLELNVFKMLPLFSLSTSVNEHGSFTAKRFMLYSEPPCGKENHTLPAGRYLSVTFRGSISETPSVYARLEDYMRAQDLRAVDDPIEFWTINEYTTQVESEFVHVLQQRVEPRTQ